MRTTRMLRFWGSLAGVSLLLSILNAPSLGQEDRLFPAPPENITSYHGQAVAPEFTALSVISLLDIPRDIDTSMLDEVQQTNFEEQSPRLGSVFASGSIESSVEPASLQEEVIVPCEAPTAAPCQSGCTANCGSLCGPRCCPIWARFELLGWALDGYSTPALVTGSPAGTPQNTAGVLGNPSTNVLFGNREFGDDLRLGGRFQAGYWFDACRRIGIQGDFFALGSDNDNARFDSDGSNTLARPFFNTDPAVNGPDAQIFSMPGLAEGSLRFDTSSRIYSAGPALRFNLCCCEDACANRSRRTDFLLGYRYFRVEEEFAAQEVLRPTDGLFPAGTRYELNDRIRTENDFHGVEFGLNHMFQRGKWLLDISNVLAVGQVRRVAELDGSTRITVPGAIDETFAGGFFVGSGDVGRFVDHNYAVLPQVRANLSYCIANNWRLGVGYNFLYLSSMFRPDSFLNTTFDGSQLGRAPTTGVVAERPATPDRNAYLHGVSLTATYNF